MKHILYILVAFVLSGCFLPATEAPSVRSLEGDQTLAVRFTSVGCFHGFTDIIILTKGEASIYSIETNWSEEKKEPIEVGRKHLGTVKLTDEDVSKLDALFTFYASKPLGGCTTSEQINVSLMDGDEVLKTYEFVDATCSTYDMESVLTFGALKAKLEK